MCVCVCVWGGGGGGGGGSLYIQRPVTRSFDVCFHLRPNKRLSKQPRGWWFETPLWSLWRHCNDPEHYVHEVAVKMRMMVMCEGLILYFTQAVFCIFSHHNSIKKHAYHVGAILYHLPILCISFIVAVVLPWLYYLYVVYCRAIALVANATCWL